MELHERHNSTHSFVTFVDEKQQIVRNFLCKSYYAQLLIKNFVVLLAAITFLCAPRVYKSLRDNCDTSMNYRNFLVDHHSTLTFTNVLRARAQVTDKVFGYLPGDLMIGGLFPVHYQPETRTAYTGGKCGHIQEQYGIQRVEAALQTIKRINENPNLLPDVTLGLHIRDSCWYPPVALEQSIEFILDILASKTANLTSSPKDSSNTLDHLGVPSHSAHVGVPQQQQTSSALTLATHPVAAPPGTTSSFLGLGARRQPIVGMIGPASSAVAIQVQNLLTLFSIPQIGYSATSRVLSDKADYKYFLRVVPSDKLQAKAMADLVRHFNWTYISAVYTEGSYGASGMEQFRLEAESQSICFAQLSGIHSNAEPEKFDSLVKSLNSSLPKARVVACFCEGETIRGLLSATRRLNLTGSFLLVGSDGWADRWDVVDGYEEEAVGGISVRIMSGHLPNYRPHFFAIKPWNFNLSENPWLPEFWELKFNCTLMAVKDAKRTMQLLGNSSLSSMGSATATTRKPCTGEEDLSINYQEDPKLGFVVDAIYTMAHGLDTIYKEMCDGRGGVCPAMQNAIKDGDRLLETLKSVRFKGHNNQIVQFDSAGDPPGLYDIMNLQATHHWQKPFEYRKVAEWDNGQLRMLGNFQWRKNNYGARTPRSVCSEPCRFGEVKVLKTGGSKCCWTCTPCEKNEYIMDENHCVECPLGFAPAADKTSCHPIPIKHLRWSDTEAVIPTVFAAIGLLVTTFTAIVFLFHNHTTVVKASTRELSYTILLGIALAYLSSFWLTAQPTRISCALTRIMPGMSFAMIYGSLATKTNRIARILAGSKKKIMTKKPRFLTATAQLVIAGAIVGVELIVVAAMLLVEPPNSTLLYSDANTKIYLSCDTTAWGVLGPLSFGFFLIIMCTWYAIKTRNLPENFNEAKFIGFTMYTTVIVWIAFVPLYFGSGQKILTMALCVSFSASVALALNFFPKLYIIILHPERNNRSFFTTTKDLRMHIGRLEPMTSSASMGVVGNLLSGGGGTAQHTHGGGGGGSFSERSSSVYAGDGTAATNAATNLRRNQTHRHTLSGADTHHHRGSGGQNAASLWRMITNRKAMLYENNNLNNNNSTGNNNSVGKKFPVRSRSTSAETSGASNTTTAGGAGGPLSRQPTYSARSQRATSSSSVRSSDSLARAAARAPVLATAAAPSRALSSTTSTTTTNGVVAEMKSTLPAGALSPVTANTELPAVASSRAGDQKDFPVAATGVPSVVESSRDVELQTDEELLKRWLQTSNMSALVAQTAQSLKQNEATLSAADQRTITNKTAETDGHRPRVSFKASTSSTRSSNNNHNEVLEPKKSNHSANFQQPEQPARDDPVANNKPEDELLALLYQGAAVKQVAATTSNGRSMYLLQSPITAFNLKENLLASVAAEAKRRATTTFDVEVDTSTSAAAAASLARAREHEQYLLDGSKAKIFTFDDIDPPPPCAESEDTSDLSSLATTTEVNDIDPHHITLRANLLPNIAALPMQTSAYVDSNNGHHRSTDGWIRHNDTRKSMPAIVKSSAV